MKHKVLKLGKNMLRNQYIKGDTEQESSSAKKDRRVQVNLKLNISQQMPLPQRRLMVLPTCQGSDLSPLLSIHEATSGGAQHPVQGSPLTKRHGHSSESPKKGCTVMKRFQHLSYGH